MQPQQSQEEVDRVLSRLQQKGVGTSTKPVLSVNQHEMMRGRNNGYPKDMHHAQMAPRQALNEDQESMLISQGYQSAYIHHTHPKWLFRRNMNPKFDPEQRGDLTQEARNTMNPFVEDRLVKDAREESKLMTQKPPQGCSQWVGSLGLLDPLPDAPEEDPNNSIARLQGQIEELRRAAELKNQSDVPVAATGSQSREPRALKPPVRHANQEAEAVSK